MKNLNLVRDPFMKVLDQEGGEQEISIKEALINANQYKGLSGECLPQDKSIERLLRAILHRILQDYDVHGNYIPITSADQARDRWAEVWETGRFPAHPIEDYLKKYEECFNLIDGHSPFMQVHEQEKEIKFVSSKGKVARGDGLNPRSISKLVGTVFASETRPRVWADRYYEDHETLSLEEGARWLIFINNFDDASFKKPPTDIHVPFCGQMTGIYAEGANLFETLMLNLPLCQADDKLWKLNHPYWEMDSFGRSDVVTAPPDNPSLLLTYPYRRMNLKINEEGRVTGYELTGHHSFPTENYLIEPNGVLRKPDPDKGIKLGFRKLNTDILWKNYGDIFLDDSSDKSYQPGIIQWIGQMVSDYEISVPALKLRSVTVNYKSMQCVISEMTDDSLIMNSSLLANDSIDWRIAIATVVNSLKKSAYVTGIFFKNIYIAQGGDPKTEYPSKKGEEIFWNEIDVPFRDWLQGIKKISQIKKEESQIKDKVLDICLQIMRDKRSSSTLKTALGRIVKEKKGSKEIDVEYSLQKACAQYYSSIQTIWGIKRNDNS